MLCGTTQYTRTDQNEKSTIIMMTKLENTEHDEEVNENFDNGRQYIRSCIRKNPRVVFWMAVLFLSVATILPLEIMNVLYRNESLWINLYGSGDVGEADWCEAIDADLTQFIIEPWNSRSNYAFMVWGCFLVILGLSDFWNLRQQHQEEEQQRPFHNDKEHCDEEEPFVSASLSVPNPMLRYPHITLANGIFTLLLGLGSFWNHACECSYGARADVSAMLSVTVFPLVYTPVQLLTTNSDRKQQTWFDGSLSLVPPIGQTLVFVLAWYDVAPSTETFTNIMACNVATLPLVILYLYCWRNKRVETKQGRQQHSNLGWWMSPLGLACFGFGYWAWALDVNEVWCFQKGILKVLLGHAVWHLLTAVALVCVYGMYRSEQLTLEPMVREQLSRSI